MDILGSIMKKMEKPPALGEKERQLRKIQQDMLKKEQEEKERRIKEFRERITEDIKKFVEDETRTRHTFEAMDKTYRSIVYNIAEDFGLSAHSFGKEEFDRHVMLFKEEDIPCEAEMQALRRREMYNPSAEGVEETSSGDLDDKDVPQKTKRSRNTNPPEYLQKYQKQLGGLQCAKESAIKAQAENRSYGFVSSDQKRDKRTIEETLADIRARKKQKPDVTQ